MPDNLNEKLLRLESLLLNEQPCLVTAEAMAEMTSLGIGDTMAYALLLASAFGLQPDADEADRRLVYDLLLPSVKALDAADFESNPYYRNIRLPDAACRDVALTTMQYEAYQAFPCGDLYFENNKLRAPLGFFRTAFRYPAITKGGREWMTVTPNEIRTMQTAVDAARGNVLVYGLGLGYFAYMAAVKDEVETLTVVDVDESVIELFKKHIWPQFPDAASRKIIVLQQDAFANAEQSHFLRYGCPYDLVFTDLWHDVGDGLPLYRRMRDLQDRYASPCQQFHYWIEPSIKCYE
jgi:hypothetical protein